MSDTVAGSITKSLTLPGGQQPPVIKSFVKANTVQFDSNDIFDRIINARFIHKPKVAGSVPKSFTIRSDYEMVYQKDGSFQYVVCLQKPSIKLNYQQVASSVVIDVTLELTNWFVDDESILESNDQPIKIIELQVGYRNQLPDWTKPPFSLYTNTDFVNLRDNNVTTDKMLLGSGSRLVLQVLYIERVSNPPDKITRFHCVVGTLDNGLRWLFSEESLRQSANAISQSWGGRTPVNNIPRTFFELVTRRFVRSSIRYNLHEDENTKEQVISIYDNKYNVIKTLQFSDDRMSVNDADVYGVIVNISQVLWETPQERLPSWGLSDSEIKNALPIEQPIAARMQDLLPGQLKEIAKQYPFIRFYILSDGNYFAYHVKEESQKLVGDKFIYNLQTKKPFQLPAVYDITWGGTRQIRMPFSSFISSMDTVAFQARYNLNDIVGNFFTPPPKNNMYLVLLMSVVFSTNDDDNMQTLTCTDIAGIYTPTTLPDGSIQPAPQTPIPIVTQGSKIWKQITLTVAFDYSGAVDTMDGSWIPLINKMINSALGFLDANHWNGVIPTENDVRSLLADLNPSLFTDGNLNAAYNPESLVLGDAWPVLQDGDSVIINFPFLATSSGAYSPNEQILPGA